MSNRKRVVVENVAPQLNGGRFFIKRSLGEKVVVSADVFGDGHDHVEANVLYRHENERNFKEARMHLLINDRLQGEFTVEKQGFYSYMIEAWIDHPLNWLSGTRRKIEDGQNVKSELLEGAEYLKVLDRKANKTDKPFVKDAFFWFTNTNFYEKALEAVNNTEIERLFKLLPQKKYRTKSAELSVWTDRKKAVFSTWYEFFPRSGAPKPGAHGTFKDCERLLPRIADMGFDVLYFPPVHPIGEVNRKGKNNTTKSTADDSGSPWGIGSKHGGHAAIHPELGTLQDFKRLVQKAKAQGLEVAMDFALQAAPDHPWVKEHPEWFKWRPDGTVQYAENPPKKYQDILPIYFESADHRNLWYEMLNTAMYWVETCGIRIFRVDNPHTKPFTFWGWLIERVQKKYPDVLFLSEAFTRPKVMQQLAKQGFSQSYTYFTWRNNKYELTQYLEELTKTDQKEYFRPNFWPNTPDINPWSLQSGVESIYIQRYALAATLSSNTGIYGPVFEHMAHAAIPGKEEYLDSEKFQIRHWDWTMENKLTSLITKINHARHNHTSLQQTNNIVFCNTDNEQLIAYYKYNDNQTNETLIVVNLDPYYTQQGWIQLPLQALGINKGHRITVTDIITGSSYIWDKEWCYTELAPALPFHIFSLSK